MNHYHAAEVKGADGEGTGVFHYVCSNRRSGTHPVGYCTRACSHPTADEATEHYRQYMLTERLRLDGKMSGQQMQCEAELYPEKASDEPAKCGEWTQGIATVGDWSTVLCDSHRSFDNVADIYSVGEAWSSY